MFNENFAQAVIERSMKNGLMKRVPMMAVSYFTDDFCKRKYVGFTITESALGSICDTGEYCMDTILGRPVRVMEPAIFYIN